MLAAVVLALLALVPPLPPSPPRSTVTAEPHAISGANEPTLIAVRTCFTSRVFREPMPS